MGVARPFFFYVWGVHAPFAFSDASGTERIASTTTTTTTTWSSMRQCATRTDTEHGTNENVRTARARRRRRRCGRPRGIGASTIIADVEYARARAILD